MTPPPTPAYTALQMFADCSHQIISSTVKAVLGIIFAAIIAIIISIITVPLGTGI